MRRFCSTASRIALQRAYSAAALDESLSGYMTGNEAAVEVAYKMSDVGLLFPITPSSPMAESYERMVADGELNVFGQIPISQQMQSEGGCAGAAHGVLVSGGLATSFTSSQGLLLWYPNLFAIAGQLQPFVLHVASRSVATNATCILGDHQDVMAVRSSGFAMLCSRTPQECYDKALISHLATLPSRVPFMHFFDGHVVSHQMNYVEKLSDEEIYHLLELSGGVEMIHQHGARSLNPSHPSRTGSSVGNYFSQLQESVNPFFDAVPGNVQSIMDDFKEITGREYRLFSYHGHPLAKNIIVSMGSAAKDVEKMVDYLNSVQNANVGCVTVHLYRPWDSEAFLKALPHSARRVAVLDRTKEHGSICEPLCADVTAAVHRSGKNIRVIGGRYGIGGVAAKPADLKAVFDLLDSAEETQEFVLAIDSPLTIRPKDNIPVQALDDAFQNFIFYGKGGDGTISSVKNAVDVIGREGFKAQGTSSHTPHKAGAITTSELRFARGVVESSHPITNHSAHIVVCNSHTYLEKLRMLDKMAGGGTFLLNAPWAPEDVVGELPDDVKRVLAKKHLNLYVVDAEEIVTLTGGMPGRINWIMLAAFLKLQNFTEAEIASFLEDKIRTSLREKGKQVIDSNVRAVQLGMHALQRIEVDPVWADIPKLETERDKQFWGSLTDSEQASYEFVEQIQVPFTQGNSQGVGVEVFDPTGFTPIGTSKYEKRKIASNFPTWNPKRCIQCNACAFQCPHAVIRPFVFGPDTSYPEDFDHIKGNQKRLPPLPDESEFSICISPFDCTGCSLCVETCPTGALEMTTATTDLYDVFGEKWDFAIQNSINHLLDFTELNPTFLPLRPAMFEFSGACAGCAESAYMKNLVNLFGHRMMLANATGCTTVFSSYYTSSPYTYNADGCGVAYGRSLFEDAAEFGLGMHLANKSHRQALKAEVWKILETSTLSADLHELLSDWVENAFDDGELSYELFAKKGGIRELVQRDSEHPSLATIVPWLDRFVKPTQWILGGDGWAYDIGFGGLDHILSVGESVNVLVFDNELYANTGGQCSKSTPAGTTLKLAYGGKSRNKKDLAFMAMSYGNVYVATCCIANDPDHFLKSLQEASEFDGPSLIICYSPCEGHEIKGGLGVGRIPQEKLVVETGMFPLLTYDPRVEDGPKLTIHDPELITKPVESFTMNEKRWSKLFETNPERAEILQADLQDFVFRRMRRYRRMAGLTAVEGEEHEFPEEEVVENDED